MHSVSVYLVLILFELSQGAWSHASAMLCLDDVLYQRLKLLHLLRRQWRPFLVHPATVTQQHTLDAYDILVIRLSPASARRFPTAPSFT
jgi:hypothetical protein